MKNVLIVIAVLTFATAASADECLQGQKHLNGGPTCVPEATPDDRMMSSGTINLYVPPPHHTYTFEPKDDITAPELATALKTLFPAMFCHNVYGIGCDVIDDIDALPPATKRHFVRHDDTPNSGR